MKRKSKLNANRRTRLAKFAQRQHDDAIERERELAPLLTALSGRKLSLRAIAGELTKRKYVQDEEAEDKKRAHSVGPRSR